MANIVILLIVAVILQTPSNAAPKASVRPVIRTNTGEYETPETHGEVEHRNIDNKGSFSHRQTRYFDSHLRFGYPPFDFPPGFPYSYYSSHSKRDESHNTGIYGTEDDAISGLFNKLHDILRQTVRQSIPQTPHPPIPAYIPVVYIPQVNCGCSSNRPTDNSNNNPKVPPIKPTSDTFNNNKTITQTNVTVEDRFSEIDDNRRNWGILVNETDEVYEGDGSRPINLNPVPTEDPLEAPAPPVEHGTVQAGVEPEKIPNQVDVTAAPKPAEVPSIAAPKPAEVPSIAPPSRKYTPSVKDNPENFRPTLCDGAILSCCTKPVVTLNCFQAQGCEDPTIYGKPCDPEVQLTIINKFKYYQKRRAG